MGITDRLYYSDTYLARFDARVADTADAGRKVYLDRTAFYPTSGGQPHDTGLLGGKVVLDVVDEEDRIAHLLAEPIDVETVVGEVNWHRRYDHMQQHTGQHLLSAVWSELFAVPTLSFHMGPEVSTVELGAKDLAEERIAAVEARVNEIVRQARPVNIAFEASDAVEGLRKASARSGTLRIVSIEGMDRSACGGTHVRNIAELGPIMMRRWEKLRGNVRVEFLCGDRALRRAKEDFHLLSALSRTSAAAIDSLPETVAGLRTRVHDLEKDHARTVSELSRLEAAALYEQTAPFADGVRRVFQTVPAINDALRAKAQAFAGRGRAVMLLGGSDPAGVLIAAAPDSGVNAGAILKTALAQFGARGGGSATLAQGSCPDSKLIDVLKDALGFPAQ